VKIPRPASPDTAPVAPVKPTSASDASLQRMAYTQVIAATEYQDSKVGRLLTAFAFLTAASLAMANLDGGVAVSAKWYLGAGSYVALSSAYLGAFVALAVMATAFLCNSLLAPTHLPYLKGIRASAAHVRRAPSQIFYRDISMRSRAEWKRYWSETDGQRLSEQAKATYIDEAHIIANNVVYKYRRTDEAFSLFHLSLLPLASAAVTTFLALARLRSAHVVSLEFDPPARWLLAIVNLGWCSAVYMGRYSSTWRSMDDDQGLWPHRGNRYRQRRIAALLAGMVPSCCSAIMIGLMPRVGNIALVIAVAALLVGSAGVFGWLSFRPDPGNIRPPWQSPFSAGAIGLIYIVGIVAAAVLVVLAYVTVNVALLITAAYVFPCTLVVAGLLAPTMERVNTRLQFQYHYRPMGLLLRDVHRCEVGVIAATVVAPSGPIQVTALLCDRIPIGDHVCRALYGDGTESIATVSGPLPGDVGYRLSFTGSASPEFIRFDVESKFGGRLVNWSILPPESDDVRQNE